MKFDCIIHRLQICFINDALQGCVPVIDVKLYEIQGIYDKALKTSFSANLTLSSSFYNTKAGSWEPIIEKNGLDIDYQENNDGNPQQGASKYLIIDMNPLYEVININISLELMEVIGFTLSTIKD